MKKWFSLVVVVALVSIGTSLEAGIFDRIAQETLAEPIPLTDGAGNIVSAESHLPPPVMQMGHSAQKSASLASGYPFKSNCCETHNSCIKDLWKGYCSRANGDCARMQAKYVDFVRNFGSKSGCGHGDCAKRGCGNGDCAKRGCGHGDCAKRGCGKCGHRSVAYGKGFGPVRQSYPQRSPFQRSPIQWTPVQRGTPWGPVQHGKPWGPVQHGNGFSDCLTCGKARCDCHGNANRQKNFSLGFQGKSCGTPGCTQGHAPCKLTFPRFGREMKKMWTSLFSGWKQCNKCGKSTIFGSSKGGCDCGATGSLNGWSQEGSVIWEDSPVPFGQPTRAYDQPAPSATETLPVPPTPTGYSAFMQRLRQVSGSQH